ncbi:hypothetical protein JCGZ_02391 [Jatropha curcas]|uniref:Uncharacterized protein n=1 Tax=Jatropha curcas TaxID=180498 RepID=A0A067JG29_JATCU|nr:hypothetical protein JCGZ_02391 [Jatropha curcas]
MESEGASSKLSLIGSKDVDMMTKSSKLGLIGPKDVGFTLVRLPEILEYTQERKTHKTAAYYRAEAATEAGGTAAPARPAGVVLGDVPFPLGMEVVLDPSLGLGFGIVIPADLRQAPPPVQLDPEHATHRYQEICQRFGFARSYIGRLYSERHELELENGRLRRHQSRQSSTVN